MGFVYPFITWGGHHLVGPCDPGCVEPKNGIGGWDDWMTRTKDLVLGRKLQGDVILGPGASPGCPGPARDARGQPGMGEFQPERWRCFIGKSGVTMVQHRALPLRSRSGNSKMHFGAETFFRTSFPYWNQRAFCTDRMLSAHSDELPKTSEKEGNAFAS